MLIIYCIDNKLGGVTSLNYNLIAHCPIPTAKQWVIHIDMQEWEMSRANMQYPADRELFLTYSGKDNIYSVLRKLRKMLPNSEGALVLNYETEMAMLDHHSVRQTTYQLVHDDYNVNLATKYGHVVDVFICHNRYIYQQLVNLFPQRTPDIHFLPHGVHIPDAARQPLPEGRPIRLLFLGRMTEAKGIFDLPLISEELSAQGIPFEWTCIGNGPQLEQLKQQWPASAPVTFLSPSSNQEVIDICTAQDVFVLPTRFEGTPVSLLETMSVGLVPVITGLPGGIKEIVDPGIGYTLPVGNYRAFAKSIAELHRNRHKLQELSIACRKKVVEQFDVRLTSMAYHALFDGYKKYYKPKALHKLKVGARLDQLKLGNLITRGIRSLYEMRNNKKA